MNSAQEIGKMHQLKIAKRILKQGKMWADLLGGMSYEEAEKIVEQSKRKGGKK